MPEIWLCQWEAVRCLSEKVKVWLKESKKKKKVCKALYLFIFFKELFFICVVTFILVYWYNCFVYLMSCCD